MHPPAGRHHHRLYSAERSRADDSSPQRGYLKSAGNLIGIGYEIRIHNHRMETVDPLVEQARNLSLHRSHSLEKLHPVVDAHLQKIYDALTASPGKDALVQAIQHDSPSEEQPIADPLASMDAFRTYMKSAASSARAPASEPDLSAPISDYYISSSHNTYLTGNQLYGDAAASAYTSVSHTGADESCCDLDPVHVKLGASISSMECSDSIQVLLRGCRSVEIDVWDGEPDTPDSSDAEGTSDSSSDSDNEAGSSLGSKIKTKIKSKTDKSGTETKDKPAKSMSRSVSAKLGDGLRRKSTKGTSPTGDKTSPSQEPVKGEPRVLHGHTLTKGTTFREICYAIRDSAFVASDLPVVVSLEVHACLEQQQTMVDIIHDAWKGLLVELPPNADPEKLPPLGDLKRKILIKAKAVPLKGGEAAAEEEISLQPSNEASVQGQSQEPAKPSKVLEALAKLAVYTRAYHFSHFDQPGMTYLPSLVSCHANTQQRPRSQSMSSRSPKKQPETPTSTTATPSSTTTGPL